MLLKNISIKTSLNNLRFLSSNVKFPLLKNKIKGFKNTAGRNNLGKITSYHKGGGHKKKYRILSNLKYLDNLLGIVMSIEYDPNRTSKIASVYCANSKKYFYIIASTRLKIGHIIRAGKNSLTRSAHSMPLKRIPLGSYVYNLTLKNKKKKYRNYSTFGRISRTIDRKKFYKCFSKDSLWETVDSFIRRIVQFR